MFCFLLDYQQRIFPSFVNCIIVSSFDKVVFKAIVAFALTQSASLGDLCPLRRTCELHIANFFYQN